MAVENVSGIVDARGGDYMTTIDKLRSELIFAENKDYMMSSLFLRLHHFAGTVSQGGRRHTASGLMPPDLQVSLPGHGAVQQVHSF